MGYKNEDKTPADLLHIAARLKAERPAPSPLELDRIKRRAMEQAVRPSHPQRGALMKSRLALTTMIVLGAMMGGTGAGLAITSGDENAALNQYSTPGTTTGQQLTTPPTTTTTETVTTPQQVAGEEEEGGKAPTPTTEIVEPVQETQQVAAATESGGSLPFTGFLAIPLLVGGVALMGGGAVLRRRARDDS